MAAGYGKRCESCYWCELFIRRLDQNRALFARTEHEQVFVSYVTWLSEHRDPKVIAMRINADARFFAELATLGEGVPAPEAILARFQPATLVRQRLALEFLAEYYGVQIDPVAKDTDREKRRIATLLLSLPAVSVGAKILQAYCDHLLLKVNNKELSLRSTRFYLRAAFGLLQTASLMRESRPNVATAKRYLQRRPGQRASLYSFLSFLNIEMPVERRTTATVANVSRGKLRQELLVDMSRASTNRLINRQSMIRALQYFHNLSGKDAKQSFERATTDIVGDWIMVRIDKRKYWLPRKEF